MVRDMGPIISGRIWGLMGLLSRSSHITSIGGIGAGFGTSGIIIIKIIGIRKGSRPLRAHPRPGPRRDVYETEVIGAAKRPIKRAGREDGG